MTKKKLRKQFKRFANTSEQPLKLYSGALGIYIGGKQYVDVPNRPGFVYVRLLNDISQLIQAHNQTVSPVYDLPVLVVRANNRYEIYARDTAIYGSYWTDTSSYLPRHGAQHSFDPDNNGGGDLVFVHGEQFYPMMTFPSGTDGAGNVLLAPYRYFFNGYWRYTGNTGTDDLLQYKPTGSANAKLILIGVTTDTGNPFIKTGAEFSENITGAAEMTTYVPTNINVQTEIAGAIVRLVTGTQTITWANIYDARQYMGILQNTTGSFDGSFLGLNDTPNSYSGQGSKSVAVKADETGLEFVASANTFLALTDTPSSYASQGSKFVAVKSAEDGLEFVSSPGGGGGSALAVYDNSNFVATGTSISFDEGITAIATGTTVFVSSDFALIENITIIDTGTSTATFSIIPTNYTTLSVKGSIRSLRGATSDTLNFQLNGLTSVVYSYNRAVGLNTGWTFTAATGTVVPISATVPAALTTPIGNSFYMSFDMDIPSYNNPGAMKSGHGQWGSRSGVGVGGYNLGLYEFEVDDINPVTQLKFFLLSGNFTSGSSISLYGLK